MSLTDLRTELRATAMPASAADKKAFVERFLMRTTDIMEIERRDPDAWEAMHIFSTLGAIASGAYHLATRYAELAMAPSEERAQEWRKEGTVTRRQLVDAIHQIRQLDPVADWSGG